MTTEQQIEPVTQADRDAAAKWLSEQGVYFPSRAAEGESVAIGDYDNHSLVQAFARHRIVCTTPAPSQPIEYGRKHTDGSRSGGQPPSQHSELADRVCEQNVTLL